MTIDYCPGKHNRLSRLKTLFGRIPTHNWLTTHKNSDGLATRQVCPHCRVSREIFETPHEPYELEKAFTFWWRYSDGRLDEKDERQYPHCVEIPPPNSGEALREREHIDSNPPFAEAKK